MKKGESLIQAHGGYRKLKSFQVSQLVFDVTVRFCDKYDDELNIFPIKQMTDIFVGKQDAIFRHTLASSADVNKCFSLIGKKSELHLEASTAETVTAWLAAINYIMSKKGKW